jgi:hypothetical protein
MDTFIASGLLLYGTYLKAQVELALCVCGVCVWCGVCVFGLCGVCVRCGVRVWCVFGACVWCGVCVWCAWCVLCVRVIPLKERFKIPVTPKQDRTRTSFRATLPDTVTVRARYLAGRGHFLYKTRCPVTSIYRKPRLSACLMNITQNKTTTLRLLIFFWKCGQVDIFGNDVQVFISD